jgi:short-subunit dehydrogenase involved in D-alanine esterification of teichoic acids
VANLLGGWDSWRNKSRKFEDLTDLGVIQNRLDVNLLGPLKVTQAFLPSLIRSKEQL